MIHNVVLLCPHSPEVIHLSEIPSGLRFSWRDATVAPIRAWEADNLVQPVDVFRRER